MPCTHTHRQKHYTFITNTWFNGSMDILCTYTYQYQLLMFPWWACVWCTWARRDHQTDPGDLVPCSFLSCTHTGLAERLLHNSKAAKAGCSGRYVRVWVFNLPPPLFAYFVWNGNKIALVQYVDQRSAGTHKQNWKYYTFYKLTEWDESTSHSCVECTSTSPRVLGREHTPDRLFTHSCESISFSIYMLVT